MDKAKGRQVILIVDDVPANIKILGENLKSLYKVRFAVDGKGALKIAVSENPPDLILLDIMMPDMDGYEVCRRLKENEKTAKIPVIFITARDREEDETRGLDAGAVDYIKKPFSLPIVGARVRTHLELKRHRDLLEKLAGMDGLTGIPNRRRFDEVYKREWHRAVRKGSPLALVIADMDYFKAYNDNYGHFRGDDCLRLIAGALFSTPRRPGDFTARYGGEEFVSILPETDMEGALSVCAAMGETVTNLSVPHGFSEAADHVTVSLGAACVVPTETHTPEALFEAADACLYRAKKMGRNRSVVRDMNLEIERRLPFGGG